MCCSNPYGGEVLKLSVSQTTLLTAIWAAGTLIGFAHAGRALQNGANMYRLAALGLVTGIIGFSAIIFAEPLQAANLFRAGAGVIGFGGGLFAVCTMLAAMDIAEKSDNGMAIGAWGAVQASAIGIGLAAGGLIRDGVNTLVANAEPGAALTAPAAGYSVVYHLEIGLLFAAIAALGPLAARRSSRQQNRSVRFGLAELPG
jgi:BCD family chlorophyll transporter-like MFS transporter